VGGDLDLSGLRVYAVHGFLDDQVALVAFVVAQAPVPGIAEPDSSIGMHYDVVWRIERLAHPFVGKDGVASLVFVANHSPRTVLAGKQPALPVKRVPVAVV